MVVVVIETFMALVRVCMRLVVVVVLLLHLVLAKHSFVIVIMEVIDITLLLVMLVWEMWHLILEVSCQSNKKVLSIFLLITIDHQ